MANDRPSIPENVKREVRQRCYFGCVICGIPIFQYDHMVEYAEEQRHDPANLTLLCELHHGQKTHNRLSRDLLSYHDRVPFNKGKPYTPKASVVTNSIEKFSVNLGGNTFYYEIIDGSYAHILNLDFQNILEVWREDRSMLLTLRVYDQKGILLLEIDRGELRYNTASFDFELVGTTLTVRSALRAITYVFELSADGIEIKKGIFWGQFASNVAIDNGKVVIGNTQHRVVQGLSSRNCSLVVLPGWSELSELDQDGNICSRQFLKKLELNLQTVDVEAHQDYYLFLRHLFINCLASVAKRFDYRSYKTRFITELRTERELRRRFGPEGFYASTSRVLGRTLYRDFGDDLARIMQANKH